MNVKDYPKKRIYIMLVGVRLGVRIKSFKVQGLIMETWNVNIYISRIKNIL